MISFGNQHGHRKVNHSISLSVGAVAFAASLIGAGVQAAQPTDDWANGRLLVHARAGTSDDDLATLAAAHGGKARRIGSTDLHIVDLPGNSEVAVLNKLKHHPQLKFAELDRRLSPTLVSNDPYLGSQWHLPRINAGAAWDLAQGAGITIAILDSGVLASHPDLAPSLLPGWNFVDNNGDTTDVNGHGTAVAGAAAAVTNNGAGVAGVAGAARIMPLRVADAGGYAYYSTIAQAVTYAADNGARVANASFGGVYASLSVQSAAQYLKGKGGLLVVSAGNSGTNDGSPATTTMIPVSATDSSDAMATWSSFGTYVALAAPGVGIYTTGSDGGYRSVSGTSFSSPITAGVIGLMMSAKPTLSASQVETLLYSTALDLGAAGRDIYYGYGRVDAAAAVAAAAAATATDTQAPTSNISAPLANSTVSGVANVNVTATDNLGVTRVELRVNGSTVATDTSAPFQFSWDTSNLANGMNNLVAVAYDAAGNAKSSATVSVNVANNVLSDTTPPLVVITKPGNGAIVTGSVQVAVSASDNMGASAIKQSLYLDGKLVASGSGGSLTYTWNSRKAAAGAHTLQAVAQDAAGNKTTTSIAVSK